MQENVHFLFHLAENMSTLLKICLPLESPKHWIETANKQGSAPFMKGNTGSCSESLILHSVFLWRGKPWWRCSLNACFPYLDCQYTQVPGSATYLLIQERALILSIKIAIILCWLHYWRSIVYIVFLIVLRKLMCSFPLIPYQIPHYSDTSVVRVIWALGWHNGAPYSKFDSHPHHCKECTTLIISMSLYVCGWQCGLNALVNHSWKGLILSQAKTVTVFVTAIKPKRHSSWRADSVVLYFHYVSSLLIKFLPRLKGRRRSWL